MKRTVEERRARRREQNKAWRLANPESARASRTKWSAKNRDSRAKWINANPHKRKRYNENRNAKRQRDPTVNQRQLARQRANPERARAHVRRWQAAHPEKVKQYHLTFAHSERGRLLSHVNGHKRRARKLLAEADQPELMKRWWADVLKTPKLKCYWCRKNVSRKQRTHDHVIALSKGGAHTVANSVMACLPCNSSKRAKNPLDWNGQGHFQFRK